MVIAIAAAATGQYYALAAMGGAVSLVNNRGNLGDTDVTPFSVAAGFRVRSNFIVFYHQLLGIG